ncbi:MAG: energy transducer TonB [Terriglobales bacterium]
MPFSVPVRPRRRHLGVDPLAPRLSWRGTSFLLAGGSLPASQREQRQRRRALGVSLAVQAVLTAAMISGLIFGPPRPLPPPLHRVQVELLTPALPTPVLPPASRPYIRPRRAPLPRFQRLRRVLAPRPPSPPARRPTLTLPQPPQVHLQLSQLPLPLLRKAAPPLRIGQFGSPHGIPPRVATPVPAPVLGSFGRARSAPDPPDPPPTAKPGTAALNRPAATSPRSARPGAGGVKTAGFGAATTASAAPAPSPVLRLHVFGAPRTQLTPLHSPAAAAPRSFQPPQVLFWPQAAYTADAVQDHVQGEVVLQVRLCANGSIQVLSVVHGLGHGLDHSAIAAVQRLRFRPARRQGRAVDWTVLVRIQFRLAN